VSHDVPKQVRVDTPTRRLKPFTEMLLVPGILQDGL
jgi:hypothetical protein